MVGKRQFVRLLLEFYSWDLILVWNEPKSTFPTRFELLFHLCSHQSSFQVFQLGRPIDVLVNLCLLQAARNKINNLFTTSEFPKIRIPIVQIFCYDYFCLIKSSVNHSGTTKPFLNPNIILTSNCLSQNH